MKKYFFIVVCFIQSVLLFSIDLKPGMWRGVLLLREKEHVELPFLFDVEMNNGKVNIVIQNADEKIRVDEVSVFGDSVNFKMPFFDSEFRTRNYGDSLVGIWINHASKANNRIPFRAGTKFVNRFNIIPERPNLFFNGKWETTFSPGKPDSSKAIGLFKQESSYVTGTFLTETGDYRYLEGMKSGASLFLSCFDGTNVYLFIGKTDGVSIVDGELYDGAVGYEKWIARRNESFELKDPESITQLKKEFEGIDFSFPNLEGVKVSLKDEKYKNKVVIIQVMGSWCPNCKDETVYLSELYKKEKSKGLEIIALAYEKSADFEKAKGNILRLKKKLGADYEFLITGLTGAAKASESLPALSKISAFPTTIYMDRKGKVRKIYTGFSGPATGAAYEKYKRWSGDLIENLLKE